MNKIFDTISEKINPSNIRLILPENDSRIFKAKDELKKEGFQIVENDDYKDCFNIFYKEASKLKFAKNWPEENLRSYVSDPINYALFILKTGYADAFIAGATTSTSDVIRGGLRLIGVKRDSICVSSLFLMISSKQDKVFSYADCAVIPEPSDRELADIAYNTAINHKLLTLQDPKVAFLSFSTDSSADHYRVEKVKNAISIFKRKYNDIKCEDVELQFDAAISKDIAIKKYPKSVLKGSANVLIYPNLDAGNIAYKVTQRVAGYQAIGPLLQGFNRSIHDLSRGCSVQDIIKVSMIGAYQGTNNANI